MNTPQLTTDGQGLWLAVWDSNEDLGGTIETDYDVLVARFRTVLFVDADADGPHDGSIDH
jgi:hypothetical protein